MGGFEIVLELGLLVLLAATMVHAVRLHRALGAMRQDRETLMDAVAGFDSGTRQAEAGLGRLRDAAEHLGGQLSHAAALKDDLEFLSARGERLADRLDAVVRAARPIEAAGAAAATSAEVGAGYGAPGPLGADHGAAGKAGVAYAPPAYAPPLAPGYRPAAGAPPGAQPGAQSGPEGPARSQAERDLLLALRAGRL